VICVSGFLICTVAALIPAFFAARLDPVKALRYE
jgi:lipoprotein-releasing system permease protein